MSLATWFRERVLHHSSETRCADAETTQKLREIVHDHANAAVKSVAESRQATKTSTHTMRVAEEALRILQEAKAARENEKKKEGPKWVD